MNAIRRFCIAAATVCALVPSLRAADSSDIDYSRDIRPILAENCLKCHGIDDKARKANLRLDDRASALAPAKSGERAVVPHQPLQSVLLRRISSADADERMPPPAAKAALSDKQKDQLRRWIEAGAEYQPHWAFVAPRAAPLPAVKHGEWVRNEIDRFVLAKLEAEGLAPSPRADRLTLARRASLDLIGLPPTPQEADAFANDPAPDAYEQFVDRLLASPRYGERWARRWLDLARYSDTNGYEKDRQRTMWPYRDWVINALNADMPFDQFTVEQLAGDMLPNATAAQRIATGFHRNTMLNEEGGIDPLEYRYYAMVDRVGTTGTTWLGLTVACAQCHTHKYDPILNRDYYGFMAMLDNADEPRMDVPDADVAARRKEAEEKIARLTAELPDKFPTTPTEPFWEVAHGALAAASGATAASDADVGWRVTTPAPERDVYTVEFDAQTRDVDRLRLEAIADGDAGPGLTPHGNFVLNEITATVKEPGSPDARTIRFARAEADFSQPSFPVSAAIDGDPKSGWAIDDGSHQHKTRTAVFYLDKPLHLAGAAHWTIRLAQNYGEQHVLGHLRLSVGAPRAAVAVDARTAQKHAIDSAFAQWEHTASAHAVQWIVTRPDEMKSSKPTLTLQPDGSVLAGGDITKSDTYDLRFAAPKGITAVRVEALPDDSLPNRGPGMVFYEGALGDFSLSEITLSAGGAPGKFVKATASYANGGNTAAMAIDANQQTGWMIDGGQGRAHQAIFVLAAPTAAGGDVSIRLLFERYFACALGHFRISVTTDPRAADDVPMPPEVEAALATPAEQRTAGQRDAVFSRFLQVTPELEAARREIAQLRNNLPSPPTTLVMRERPAGQERATFIHHRGEWLSPEDQVAGDVPSCLPPLSADEPHNRLGLARWIVDPRNPLTARVTVNRQWQAFFGRGIVYTTGDFGFQGSYPTHPELLDWLAVRFTSPQGCRWSLKQLDRLIVTSATYQQASAASPELAARDPQNLLLARGPRFRVEAEVVRDSALKECGLLTDKIGGPSVFPPQPPSVTTEGAYGPMQWNASAGADRYRRSLYTFSKRTAPFAMYVAFDAPAGDVCTGRRDLSNSPLQALTLLNDQMFMECAQALGKSIAQMKGANDEQCCTELFRRCLTRPPAPQELTALLAFARDQRTRLASGELKAADLAGSAAGDLRECAVWTTVARAVLNLDEAITR